MSSVCSRTRGLRLTGLILWGHFPSRASSLLISLPYCVGLVVALRARKASGRSWPRRVLERVIAPTFLDDVFRNPAIRASSSQSWSSCECMFSLSCSNERLPCTAHRTDTILGLPDRRHSPTSLFYLCFQQWFLRPYRPQCPAKSLRSSLRPRWQPSLLAYGLPKTRPPFLHSRWPTLL